MDREEAEKYVTDRLRRGQFDRLIEHVIDMDYKILIDATLHKFNKFRFIDRYSGLNELGVFNIIKVFKNTPNPSHAKIRTIKYIRLSNGFGIKESKELLELIFEDIANGNLEVDLNAQTIEWKGGTN